jgi:hypothetical protein
MVLNSQNNTTDPAQYQPEPSFGPMKDSKIQTTHERETMPSTSMNLRQQ